MKTLRWVLLNPGPVNVTPRVRWALMGPDLCHREEEFSVLLRRVRKNLLRLFGAERSHTAALLTGSGTLAVETMLSAYGARAGRKILVLSNGVYGDRMRDMLAAHRVPHMFMPAAPGQFPPFGEIEERLKDASVTAVALVHHETSTGMLNPLGAVSLLAKKYGKTLLVDAVSSLGAEKIDFSGIGFLAGSSGKCLHGHPGLAFVIVSNSEARALEGSTSVYMNLKEILASEDKDSPPFTPAVPLVYSFDAALAELSKETVAGRIRGYEKKSALLVKGLEALGIRFLVEKKYRSHVLTALWIPDGASYETLHARLKKKKFVIYAGQSVLKDRIFRVANLGDVTKSDLRRFLRGLETVVGKRRPAPKAVVLAAGVGKRFGAATLALPKCLLPIDGTTLLQRYLDAFRQTGVKEVVIVVGHLQDKVRRECARYGKDITIRFVENREYRKGSILSLQMAGSELKSDVLVMDADVYFPVEALQKLVDSPKSSAFLLDTRSKSTGEEMMLMAKKGRFVKIAKKIDPALEAVGEATGIVKFSGDDARALRRILDGFVKKGIDSVEYEDAYTELMKSRSIGYETVGDIFWSEIDFEEDLKRVLSAARP